MWFYMILTLLWFGSGHTYPKLESTHRSIYEIQEDKATNSIKFINPEAEKPILREITYYHVVERPYDGVSSIPVEANNQLIETEDSSEEELKTERPFTNGHGYQFIDHFPILLNDSTKISDVDDLVEWIFSDNVDEESTDGDVDDDDTESKEEYYEDDETDTEEVKEDPNISKNIIVDVVTEKGKIIEKNQAVTTEKTIHISQDDKSTDNIQKEDTQDNEKVFIETTTKSSRHHQLFDSPEKLEERYQKMKNFVKVKEPSVNGQLSKKKTNTRRKRSTRKVKEIPEAPTLPELNYEGLPDYIKSVIFTEKPFEKKEEQNMDGRNKHEQYRKNIRRKMEEMFDSVAPDNSKRQGDKIIPLNNEEDDEVYPPIKNVRTYGMNLKEDGGHVWNNLWSNPGQEYNVGKLKPKEESNDFKALGSNPSQKYSVGKLKPTEESNYFEALSSNPSQKYNVGKLKPTEESNDFEAFRSHPGQTYNVGKLKPTEESNDFEALSSNPSQKYNVGKLKSTEESEPLRSNPSQNYNVGKLKPMEELNGFEAFRSNPGQNYNVGKLKPTEESSDFEELNSNPIQKYNVGKLKPTEESNDFGALSSNPSQKYNVGKLKPTEESNYFETLSSNPSQKYNVGKLKPTEESNDFEALSSNPSQKYNVGKLKPTEESEPLSSNPSQKYNVGKLKPTVESNDFMELRSNPGQKYNVGKLKPTEESNGFEAFRSNPSQKYNVGKLKPMEESNSFEENEEHTVILTTTHKPPRPHKPHTTQKSEDHEEHNPVYIDSQEDMFDNVSPDDAEEEEEQIHINIEDGVVNTPTREVRTYGMNLTGDRGYVWNDMWSNPGLRYNVGNLKTADESKEIEANKEEYPKPELTTTHKPRPHNPDTTKPSEHEEFDLDDILVNIGDKDEHKKEPHQLHGLPNETPGNEQKRQRTEIEDDNEELTPMNNEDEESDNIPEKLNDLLKNEKFWEWLSDWTGTYMNLVTEHIGNVVKEEISKHMANHDREKDVAVEPQNEGNEKEEIQNLNSNELKEKEINDMEVQLIKKQSEENDVPEYKTKTKKSEEKTIFINGKEFPVTTSSNFDIDNELDDTNFFRSRKNKDDKKEVDIIKDNEPKKDVKVIAQNIYGNSLESGKVTNMFFFFDQERSKHVMDDIKPLLNEKNNSATENFIIDNRIKEPSFTEDTEKQEKFPTEDEKIELIQPTLDKNIEENLPTEDVKVELIQPTLDKNIEENLPTEDVKVELIQPILDKNTEETDNPAFSQDKPNLEEKKTEENNKDDKELEINPEDKVTLETENTKKVAAENTEVKEDKTSEIPIIISNTSDAAQE